MKYSKEIIFIFFIYTKKSHSQPYAEENLRSFLKGFLCYVASENTDEGTPLIPKNSLDSRPSLRKTEQKKKTNSNYQSTDIKRPEKAFDEESRQKEVEFRFRISLAHLEDEEINTSNTEIRDPLTNGFSSYSDSDNDSIFGKEFGPHHIENEKKDNS